MTKKLCINCKYFGRITVEPAPGRLARVPACLHPDFVNPIDGNPMPVQVVRDHAMMCTFHGKGFIAHIEEVQEESTKAAIPKQGELILVND